MMQYGFWGEGHTSNLPHPFPDDMTAERTFVEMTELQLETWKKTPLAFNTQPDISKVGNRKTLAMAMSAGAWLRSDSIIIEEPIQIDQLANRPPWLAAILEDGYFRQYDISKLAKDSRGVNVLHLSDSAESGDREIELWRAYLPLESVDAQLPPESERPDHTFHLRSLASQYGDGIHAELAAQEIMRLLREESDLAGDRFEALTRVILGAFTS